ncbi:hypothetical protein OG801_27335 [Nocardioides sp. NBC_00163]|uniref:hypothetical protein n=1 Tax=Nocardioides sp. NBC_00163 TaxID=2975999 RepID=UPI00324991EB
MALLGQAAAVFDGKVVIGSEAIRGACWLARGALEDGVHNLLSAYGHDVGSATMRTKLGCLESALADHDPDLARTARYAWLGLSELCHHHAYELTPTVGQARHLLEMVTRVCLATPPG